MYMPDEIAVKLKMLEKSQESFLLIDSTKIGKVATTQWLELKNIDHIITDSRIQPASIKNFSNVDFPLIISLEGGKPCKYERIICVAIKF